MNPSVGDGKSIEGTFTGVKRSRDETAVAAVLRNLDT
jgi:hypothetical protein